MRLPVLVELAILLESRDSKTGHSTQMNRSVPTGELFNADRIALTDFIYRQQSTFNRCDDFRLAPYHPSLRADGGELVESQRLAQWADYLRSRIPLGLEHAHDSMRGLPGSVRA
jgi:hypothetical protein